MTTLQKLNQYKDWLRSHKEVLKSKRHSAIEPNERKPEHFGLFTKAELAVASVIRDEILGHKNHENNTKTRG